MIVDPVGKAYAFLSCLGEDEDKRLAKKAKHTANLIAESLKEYLDEKDREQKASESRA